MCVVCGVSVYLIFDVHVLCICCKTVAKPVFVEVDRCVHDFSWLVWYVGWWLCVRFCLRGPFLVVVPLSTVPNWVREFRRWTPQVRVDGGKDRIKAQDRRIG